MPPANGFNPTVGHILTARRRFPQISLMMQIVTRNKTLYCTAF
jgi:hypothetical protein